jgi:hypothetical protein
VQRRLLVTSDVIIIPLEIHEFIQLLVEKNRAEHDSSAQGEAN